MVGSNARPSSWYVVVATSAWHEFAALLTEIHTKDHDRWADHHLWRDIDDEAEDAAEAEDQVDDSVEEGVRVLATELLVHRVAKVDDGAER